MSLSDTAIKNAKPNPDKPYKMQDEKGMYVLINSNGSKYFRYNYRFAGKRKTLALGTYPEISLKQAREKRNEAKRQILESIDPGESRKEAKTAKAHTFEQVTRDWLASTAHTVREITHQKKIRRFELYVFPAIGDMATSEIKSPDVYKIIKPIIAKNQLETAHRVHSEIGAAFAYAIAHGYTDYDPAQAVAAQIPAVTPISINKSPRGYKSSKIE